VGVVDVELVTMICTHNTHTPLSLSLSLSLYIYIYIYIYIYDGRYFWRANNGLESSPNVISCGPNIGWLDFTKSKKGRNQGKRLAFKRASSCHLYKLELGGVGT
jgi:hypothetical protein